MWTSRIRTLLLGVLTLCAVGLSVAAARWLRWRPVPGVTAPVAVVDTWRGLVCTPTACFALGHEPVPTPP